jgi:NADH-quinone oxidoreductase subunit N
MQTPTNSDLVAILPSAMLVVWGMALLLVALLVPRGRRSSVLAVLALLGLGATLLVSGVRWDDPITGFDGSVVLDNYSLFLSIVFLVAGILTILLSLHYLRDRQIERFEYYPLLLFSISGMTLMSSVNDFVLLFIALELLSIPLYVLAGFARPDVKSEESAMKYFLLGAFASAFLIFGIALVYGGTGTTLFPGVAALGRVLLLTLPALSDDWVPVVAALAALTLILGNLVALVQNNIKRMLAYSSIAHAGYLLMGVAARNERGLSALLFYLFAYAFTNLGAFAVVTMMARREGEDLSFAPYSGLARRQPWVAGAMALFMLSLTGIPPTGGLFLPASRRRYVLPRTVVKRLQPSLPHYRHGAPCHRRSDALAWSMAGTHSGYGSRLRLVHPWLMDGRFDKSPSLDYKGLPVSISLGSGGFIIKKRPPRFAWSGLWQLNKRLSAVAAGTAGGWRATSAATTTAC